MHDRTTQKFHAVARRQSGQVIPLRSLHRASYRSALSQRSPASPTAQEIADTTLHAVQNCLQTVGLGLDLLQLPASVDAQDYEPMRHSVERAGRLILELREYCCPPPLHLSTESLAEVVGDIVQGITREWERPGRTTRVICHTPYTPFTLDWQQTGKALERTVACAYAMLPSEGGEVIVESGIRTIDAHQFVDIRVRSHGMVPLSIREEAIFYPFAYINGHQLGLSLILAQRAAGRLHGQLFFRQISSRQGCFTLRLRA